MPKKKLEYETTNCWDAFAAKKHATRINALADRYLDFLTRCKTEREVVDEIVALAAKAGFAEGIGPDTALRTFRGKTVMLVRRGKRPLREGIRLIGSHGDAPRLDLKQRPLYEDCSVSQLKTHYYGGIRKYQWMSRPLALHGVVALKSGETVRVVLGEDAGDPVFLVPDLLPHLAAKQAGKKLSEAFDAEKLNILVGHQPVPKPGKGEAEEDDAAKEGNRIKRHILELLHARYGMDEADFLSAELQAVPAGPARRVGLDGALLGGYAHDDRICVYASLEAFFEAKQPEHTQVLLVWDREEIGSDGSTGAKSLFFEYCMEDILRAWEPDTRLGELFFASKAVSADVAAGLDPDYQDVHEKRNAALMGHGPSFSKFTGHRGKYGASEAHAEFVGWFRGLLDKTKIPWQMAELGKVDEGGGGTVAKYLAAYGMDIIDFGPAVLSMHSPFEIASSADLYATLLAYKAFLES